MPQKARWYLSGDSFGSDETGSRVIEKQSYDVIGVRQPVHMSTEWAVTL